MVRGKKKNKLNIKNNFWNFLVFRMECNKAYEYRCSKSSLLKRFVSYTINSFVFTVSKCLLIEIIIINDKRLTDNKLPA